jgi:prephenate dehydrogenase
VGIVGTGLIGTSIGLKAAALGAEVLGCDADAEAAEQALAAGGIRRIVTLDEIYARSETIVFATPARATAALLGAIDRRAQPRAQLLIDVSSVKAPIVRSAAGLRNFVATHPMAGSESSGAAAARPDLFAGKPWLYVGAADSRAGAAAVAFIRAMDALPVAVEAERHDAIVAATSHLPQLVAWLFAEMLSAYSSSDAEEFRGPAARELMRLSRSNPSIWSDVFALNAANLGAQARVLAEKLTAAAESLERG